MRRAAAAPTCGVGLLWRDGAGLLRCGDAGPSAAGGSLSANRFRVGPPCSCQYEAWLFAVAHNRVDALQWFDTFSIGWKAMMASNDMDLAKIEQGVRLILEGVGEDPNREGLLETPARVARMYEECFAGLHQDPAVHFETLFDEHHDEMVIVHDIPFFSMCEHHLVPFFGKAHIAYLPSESGKICGISKLARLVEVYARRPQVQERLTSQVADTLVEQLNPRGVAVVMEAEHLCMSMRGVKKPGAKTVTNAMRGIFKEDAATRAEALSLLMGR